MNRPVKSGRALGRWLAAAAFASIAILPSVGFAQIADGDTVTFEYTLRDDKGNELDSSRGREPLTYEHGSGSLIRGLERQLTGLKPGDQRLIRVTPDEGHGPRDPRNFREVARNRLPAKDLRPGDMFAYVGPDGRRSPVTVLDVKEKTVVLDFNSPLAGKTLIFEIRIVKVEKSTTGP